MKPIPFPPPPENDPVGQAAAEWVLRLDRGLTAAEQDAYSQWLAADPRHGEAIAEHRWGWDELDRLAGIQDSVHALPDPDLLRPAPSERVVRYWPQLLATAAAVILAAVVWWPRPAPVVLPPVPAVAPSYALAAPIEERTLADGSVVTLNRGAQIDLAFTAGERRVKLLRGEASFAVAKNPARPFIVSAGGVDVRAVGTVFNVRLGNHDVEVVVAEGKVGVRGPVAAAASAAAGENLPPPAEVLLTASQQVVVPIESAAPVTAVATLDEAEIARRLAWQPRLLDFTDTAMADIVAEFNRRNVVQLRLADARLEAMRLSATIRSDNVEGFVRLMESDFGLRAEWRGEAEIALHRK